MDWRWCRREREEAGMTSRAWPEHLTGWSSHCAENAKIENHLLGHVCILFWLHSSYKSQSDGGKKASLMPGMGPQVWSASTVEAMEKGEKEQKRRANICLMVCEQVLGFWGPRALEFGTMGQGNGEAGMSIQNPYGFLFQCLLSPTH